MACLSSSEDPSDFLMKNRIRLIESKSQNSKNHNLQHSSCNIKYRSVEAETNLA